MGYLKNLITEQEIHDWMIENLGDAERKEWEEDFIDKITEDYGDTIKKMGKED